MIKPTATACMAMSLPMPRKEHARGINRSEPPATPEAPQAPRVATTLRNTALGKLTSMPRVWATARVITVMVTAAPFILTVAPSGILTE